MEISKIAASVAIGILALTSGGTATAGDWQALGGVAATPMTPAQMEAVQGRAIMNLPTIAGKFDNNFSGPTASYVFGPATLQINANANVSLVISGSGNGSASFVIPTTVVSYPLPVTPTN